MPPARLAKKVVRREEKWERKREAKEEERGFRAMKASARAGGAGEFVNRVRLNKRKEKKVARELSEGRRSKTLER